MHLDTFLTDDNSKWLVSPSWKLHRFFATIGVRTLSWLFLIDLIFSLVRDVANVKGSGSSGFKSRDHTFTWRDIYYIPIRWRQFSEVNNQIETLLFIQ